MMAIFFQCPPSDASVYSILHPMCYLHNYLFLCVVGHIQVYTATIISDASACIQSYTLRDNILSLCTYYYLVSVHQSHSASSPTKYIITFVSMDLSFLWWIDVNGFHNSIFVFAQSFAIITHFMYFFAGHFQ